MRLFRKPFAKRQYRYKALSKFQPETYLLYVEDWNLRSNTVDVLYISKGLRFKWWLQPHYFAICNPRVWCLYPAVYFKSYCCVDQTAHSLFRYPLNFYMFCAENESIDCIVDTLIFVYASWIQEAISNYNTDFFYQSREYIFESWKEGTALQ